jgi:predicted  nucleic acid-binding Zn-ribbon protein
MVSKRGERPLSNRGDAPAVSPERAALAATIAEEDARRRRLEAELAEAKERVDALRAKLAALDDAPTERVIRTLDHESATDRSDEVAEWVP